MPMCKAYQSSRCGNKSDIAAIYDFIVALKSERAVTADEVF